MTAAVPHRPLYQELRNRIAQEIANGRYPAGSELPSLAEMSRLYAASPGTVARVVELLRRERLIHCRKGRRPRVARSGGQRDGRRIAILLNAPDRDGVHDYADGPSTWLLHQKILQKLLLDHNPALNLSYRYDWEHHLDHIDGVIALEVHCGRYREPARLRQSGIPCVKVGTFLPEVPANNTLMIDYAPAMEQIATYFLANGVKAVFINEMDRPEPGAPTRTAAFRQALLGHGIAPEHIHTEHFRHIRLLPEALAAVRDWLRRTPGPVGVLTPGDLQAGQIVELGLAEGRTLKKDLFVVGLSGLPESALGEPALSTVEFPFGELAERAVNMLYGLLRDHVTETASVSIPLRFHPRGT